MNPNHTFKQTVEVEEPEEVLLIDSGIIWVGSGAHKLYVQEIKERKIKTVMGAKGL